MTKTKSRNWTTHIKESTLSNGLKLYLYQVPGSGRVFADLWLGVGAKHEKPQEFGISHFLEHMIFKGNERFGPGKIDLLTESSGGYNNAATHSEYTHYYFVMPERKLDLALTLLFEMCTRPAIDAGEFEREREVVIEEIKQYRDHPVYGAYLEHQNRFYEGTAWGHSTLGTEETLMGMSPDSMRRYHKRHYTPENAALVVSGGFKNADSVIESVENVFLGWNNGSVSRRPNFGSFKCGEFKRFTKSANQSVYGFLSLSAFGGGLSKEGALLTVFLYALGAAYSSRLHQGLMVEEHLCQEYDFSTENTWPSNSVLFNFTTDETAKVARILEVFKRCLHSAALRPLSMQEISSAKAALISQRAADSESAPGAGSWLGELAYPRHSIEEIERYEEFMEKATPNELQDIASRLVKYIERAGLTVSYPKEMNKPQAPGSLRKYFQLARMERASSSSSKSEPHFIAELDCGAKLFGWPSGNSRLFAAKFYIPYNILAEPLAGISRIANQVLVKGTKGKSAVDISRYFESVGGSIGPAFSQLHLGVETGVLASDWRLPIEIVPEILSDPAFDGIETAKSVWEAQAALKTQRDQNRSVAWAEFARTFFKESPFGVQPLGEEKDLGRITHSRLHKYFKSVSSPEKMLIVAAGNFDGGELVETLNREFGKRKFDGNRAAIPKEGKFKGEKRRLEIEMDKEQTALVVGIPAPGIGQPEHEFWEIINCVLGVGATSRFFVNLRDRDSLAYAVYSMYIAGRKLGCLATTILTSREKVNQAWDGIFREIAGVFEKGITKTEFEAAKTFVVQQSLNAIETTPGKARELAKAVLLNLPPEHALARIEMLKNIKYSKFLEYTMSLEIRDWGAVQVGRI